jgi:hypothetical protein
MAIHIRPFQVFSMFSVHPKIKNLSFYQVKTHRWVEKKHSSLEYFISNKTFYHDHSNFFKSCTIIFICHCNLLYIRSLFCIQVTESLMNIIFYILCFHDFDQDRSKLHMERTSQVLLNVFCFTFHSLKPIRPRTLNIEKTWNGLIGHFLHLHPFSKN